MTFTAGKSYSSDVTEIIEPINESENVDGDANSSSINQDESIKTEKEGVLLFKLFTLKSYKLYEKVLYSKKN